MERQEHRQRGLPVQGGGQERVGDEVPGKTPGGDPLGDGLGLKDWKGSYEKRGGN